MLNDCQVWTKYIFSNNNTLVRSYHFEALHILLQFWNFAVISA